MAPDPLASLVKVRKRACDEAQRSLVNALTQENRAEQASHGVELKIAQETEAATNVNGSDAMVEAFAAWLPAARHQLAHFQQVLLDRQAETMRCRAEVTASKTALEIVETLMAERRIAAQHAAEMIFARDLNEHSYRSEDDDGDLHAP